MGDGLWVRLVDVGAALAGRTYAGGRRASSSTCATSCARGTRAAGASRRRADAPSAAPDLALDVADARRRIPRRDRLRAARQGGWVEELVPGAIDRADGFFRHGLHPWCPEIF